MTGETLFAAGYAASLTFGAFALEWLSAHTHKRALRFRTAGFEYVEAHDYWTCPEGEQLWPHELDRERRLMRYRARPQVCNACHAKHRCTDSSRGREIVRPLDPWPHSEAGRFHRVIALVMVALSALILLVEALRSRELDALGLLLGLLTLVAAAARWMLRDLRRHPSGFPTSSPAHGLRVEATPRAGLRR